MKIHEFVLRLSLFPQGNLSVILWLYNGEDREWCDIKQWLCLERKNIHHVCMNVSITSKNCFWHKKSKKKKDQNYIPNQFWRSVTWIGIMYMPLLVVAGKNTMLKALILEELLKTIIIDEASSYKRRRDSEFVKWGSLIADKNNLNLALRRKMFLNTDYLK